MIISFAIVFMWLLMMMWDWKLDNVKHVLQSYLPITKFIDLKKILKNANIEFGTTLVAKKMEKENVQAINQ